MSIENHTPPGPGGDPAHRIAELETELARARAERDEYKAAAYSLLGQLVPYKPVTDEELHDMLHGPRGRPILEVIAELEREQGGQP